MLQLIRFVIFFYTISWGKSDTSANGMAFTCPNSSSYSCKDVLLSVPVEDSCLIMKKSLKNWSYTRRLCQENEASMPVIKSRSRNNAFIDVAQRAGLKKFWLGLYKNKSRYYWVDGSAFSFKKNYNSFSAKPKIVSDHLSCTFFHNGLWKTCNCNDTFSTLCEKKPVLMPDEPTVEATNINTSMPWIDEGEHFIVKCWVPLEQMDDLNFFVSSATLTQLIPGSDTRVSFKDEIILSNGSCIWKLRAYVRLEAERKMHGANIGCMTSSPGLKNLGKCDETNPNCYSFGPIVITKLQQPNGDDDDDDPWFDQYFDDNDGNIVIPFHFKNKVYRKLKIPVSTDPKNPWLILLASTPTLFVIVVVIILATKIHIKKTTNSGLDSGSTSSFSSSSDSLGNSSHFMQGGISPFQAVNATVQSNFTFGTGTASKTEETVF